MTDHAFTISAMSALRDKIWATRDACFLHYPMECPVSCKNAGKHNDSLGELCECRECR